MKTTAAKANWNLIASTLVHMARFINQLEKYLQAYSQISKDADNYLRHSATFSITNIELEKVKKAISNCESNITKLNVPNHLLATASKKRSDEKGQQDGKSKAMKFGGVAPTDNATQDKITQIITNLDQLETLKKQIVPLQAKWNELFDQKDKLFNDFKTNETVLIAKSFSPFIAKKSDSFIPHEQIVEKLGLKPSSWMAIFVDKLRHNYIDNIDHTINKLQEISKSTKPFIPIFKLNSSWRGILEGRNDYHLTDLQFHDLATTAVVALVTNEEDESLSEQKVTLKLEPEFINLSKDLYRYMNRQLYQLDHRHEKRILL
jgi:hypothetical protein